MIRQAIIITTAFAFAAPPGAAQLLTDNTVKNTEQTDAGVDVNDAITRINPAIDNTDANKVITRRDLTHYPFLNLAANHIIMNGSNWTALAGKFESIKSDNGTVSIIHIGDSHIQPDGSTGQVRKILQSEFGNAGRGLLSPLKITRTNAPLDFKLTTTSPVTTATLMRMPWPVKMGFTGVAVHPDVLESVFTLSTKQTFRSLRLYATGKPVVTEITDDGQRIPFTYTPEGYGALVKFDQPVQSVTLHIKGHDVVIFGFDVRNDSPGILYHNIGNNGATYSTYSFIGNMGRHIAALTPDLIIISLGTNEAFGRLTTDMMLANIDMLVNDIRRHNPGAQILLTTPSECQRSVYTRVRRSRRRRARRVRSYSVNSKVALARDAILRYGKEHNIPVYDFYAVAGGEGSSAKWLQSKLLSSDRIHRTWSGYYLEGELLADAITGALVQAGLSKINIVPTVKVEKSTEIEKPKPVVKKKKTNIKKSKKKRRSRRRRR